MQSSPAQFTAYLLSLAISLRHPLSQLFLVLIFSIHNPNNRRITDEIFIKQHWQFDCCSAASTKLSSMRWKSNGHLHSVTFQYFLPALWSSSLIIFTNDGVCVSIHAQITFALPKSINWLLLRWSIFYFNTIHNRESAISSWSTTQRNAKVDGLTLKKSKWLLCMQECVMPAHVIWTRRCGARWMNS